MTPARRRIDWPAFCFSIRFSLRNCSCRMARYLSSRGAPKEILQSILRGQVHTLGVGMHNFMDASMVARADDDPTIKARLDSCVFKGAVKRNGQWEAVPMCSMNQQTWSEVYDSRLQRSRALPRSRRFSHRRPKPRPSPEDQRRYSVLGRCGKSASSSADAQFGARSHRR